MRWLPFIRRIGGTMLFVVGVVALALPIVPGWALIAVGLYLLSIDSPGMRRRVAQLRTRHARLDRVLGTFDRFLGHQPEQHVSRARSTHEED